MEQVCFLPEENLRRLVSFVLFLLNCPHKSARCYAAMFIRSAIQIRVILDLFDLQNVLEQLYNRIEMLMVLPRDGVDLRDDQQYEEEPTHIASALKQCNFT